MYERLLVVTTRDRNETKRTLALACRLVCKDGSIQILCLKDEKSLEDASVVNPSKYSAYVSELRNDDLEGKNADITVTYVSGHPASQVVEHSEDFLPCCIIVSSERFAEDDYFFGSMGARLLSQTECAVHVAR